MHPNTWIGNIHLFTFYMAPSATAIRGADNETGTKSLRVTGEIESVLSVTVVCTTVASMICEGTWIGEEGEEIVSPVGVE